MTESNVKTVYIKKCPIEDIYSVIEVSTRVVHGEFKTLKESEEFISNDSSLILDSRYIKYMDLELKSIIPQEYILYTRYPSKYRIIDMETGVMYTPCHTKSSNMHFETVSALDDEVLNKLK